MPTNGYPATDMEIVLATDTEYMLLAAELGSYRSAMSANIDSRYVLEKKFPELTMINRSHALDLTSLIYNDSLAADTIRQMNNSGDTLLTYALIHVAAKRFGPYGQAVLGSIPLAADSGIFTLTTSNLGSGKVQYRNLIQASAAVSTAVALASTPLTVLANLRDKGTATAIAVEVAIAGNTYDADVDLTNPSVSELTLLFVMAPVPANQPAGALTITSTPASATFELDIGV